MWGGNERPARWPARPAIAGPRRAHGQGSRRPDVTGERGGDLSRAAERVADGIRLAVKDLFDTAGCDNVRLGDLRRPRPRRERAGRSPRGGRGVRGRGQDEPARVRLPGLVAEPALRDGAELARPGASPAARAAARRPRSRPDWPTRRSEATAAARSGSLLPGAASSASSRRTGLVPMDGCFPLAPSFDHAGPMARTVDDCAALLRALVPGFASHEPIGLEDVELGVAWLDACEPLVRARVEAAAELFPRRRPVDLRFPEGTLPLFMREVADVHHTLFAEQADQYGDNVRTKVERCLRVTGRRGARSRRGAQSLPRAGRGGERRYRPAAPSDHGLRRAARRRRRARDPMAAIRLTYLAERARLARTRAAVRREGRGFAGLAPARRPAWRGRTRARRGRRGSSARSHPPARGTARTRRCRHTTGMTAARLTVALLAALALAPAAHARADAPRLTAPDGLRAFLLRADEPQTREYSRTPSFAWKPVPRTVRYEFQLSTSDTFRDGGIVYRSTKLKTPAYPAAAPAPVDHRQEEPQEDVRPLRARAPSPRRGRPRGRTTTASTCAGPARASRSR